jgi:5'-deoxynucleotidase YfbR-like HD superfamily hydrolase
MQQKLAPQPLVVHRQSRAWQRMLSGRRLDLLDPSPLDIEIGDIAHGLARVARWNGQTKGAHAFSVAQHCVLVEQIAALIKPAAGPHFRMAALLHDAPEYVVGDLISPFKAAMGKTYKTFELRIQRAVHIRFGLPPELAQGVTQAIKRADKIAAFFEATELAGFAAADARACFGDPDALGIDWPTALRYPEPVDASAAQSAFLAQFEALEVERRAGADRPKGGARAP